MGTPALFPLLCSRSYSVKIKEKKKRREKNGNGRKSGILTDGVEQYSLRPKARLADSTEQIETSAGKTIDDVKQAQRSGR